MTIWDDIITALEPYSDVIQLILIFILSFMLLSIILRIIERRLLEKAKTKKQKTNVTVFTDMLKYVFGFFLILIIVAYYSGKLGDLGFVAGLLTVALGWALQKPISGVVAWIILVTKRPIHIGDRVIVMDIKGDITNITLTHIYLDEVGGTIDGEEKSGRTVMIPTSTIFEKEIINFTEKDDYILDEIIASITYESDLEKAEEVVNKSVEKIMEPLWENFPKRIDKEPHTRLNFQSSGIDISVRYYTIAMKRNEISTNIRREIWKQITKSKDIEFAYPHTEVLFRQKEKGKE